MDRFERVRQALQSGTVDHVPSSFWFHFPEDQVAGHAMAQAHLAYYRQAGQDFLKVMNDNGYALEGVDTIKSPTDWGKLRPAPLNSRPFQAQLDGLKEILDTVGGEVPVITTIFNPFGTAVFNRSGVLDYHGDPDFARFMMDLRSAPAAVESGLMAIADSLAVFARACIEAGAAGLFFSSIGGERRRFTPLEFERWIKPGDLAILQAAVDAGAWFNFLHICRDSIQLESYLEHPAHVFNWAAQKGNLSIAEGHDLFKKPVAGGMDERGILVNGSRGEIEAEVERVIETTGRTGFLLGAGCTLPGDIDVRHIAWAQQTAERI